MREAWISTFPGLGIMLRVLAMNLRGERALGDINDPYRCATVSGPRAGSSLAPYVQWFWAAYLVTSHTAGLSALQLQRQLGIARYETAWVLLHKLRRAMVRPDRAPLHTEVEVDEAYIGGPEAGLRGGRVLEDKALVVAAVEVRGRGSGRIRLQVVPDASARSLSGFVRANVEPGTVVRTDGWPGYAPLASMSCQTSCETPPSVIV